MSSYQFSGGSRNPLFSILVAILVFVGIYYAIKGLYSLLYILSPVLLIAAAVLHFPTVVNHGKSLVAGVRRDLVIGVLTILLQGVLFPFVFAWILFKAYANRRLERFRKENGSSGRAEDAGFGHNQNSRSGNATISNNEEYIDFEEVPQKQERLYNDDNDFDSYRRTDPSRSDSYNDLFK
jgi:hypothetical protein